MADAQSQTQRAHVLTRICGGGNGRGDEEDVGDQGHNERATPEAEEEVEADKRRGRRRCTYTRRMQALYGVAEATSRCLVCQESSQSTDALVS